MKYRIIQRGDGKFQVQRKETWSDDWSYVYCSKDDYVSEDMSYQEWENSNHYKDRQDHVLSTLELAQSKLNKIVDEETREKNKEKMMKKFKLIKTVKV